MKDKPKKVPISYSEACPVLHALEIIGGKWRLPIIWEISVAKNIRYNELKRNIPGITNIMLTRSLQALEEHGLVKRVEYNKIPPHVEYSLTDECRDLLPALAIINDWGKKMWPIFPRTNK
ncbi:MULTISPECIES: helix-turn-helix domain-containing protein [unclassified Clostridium]|uniref:winged helix-turn-helix transcriptional regulator n=1 Tax=unclassified Clostridium TaxID=2614128 RepID=UPI0002973F8C|nr:MULTISPECIES: helix-turn-helix domain-containing protein [unclassified Clostridium]EKQ54464.1 MAG: putative transcriptional regulator [Clostridium sp. Maddingley MBC34-26]